MEETIVAVATAPLRSGVGIVRFSGANAVAVAGKIFFPPKKILAEAAPRLATFGHIVFDGKVFDDAIAIVMKAPASYTGEDTVELQCHGSPVLLKQIVEKAVSFGARPALPGEFTKRAFLNGKLDLVEAQAVIDLIDAKTSKSLKQAAGHLAGRSSARLKELRQGILDILVHLSAVIDFPEEGIEEISLAEAAEDLKKIHSGISKILATKDAGRILKEGLVTAIVGAPNAGKSSLLNALLNEERAIVTDVAGTTRDSIEEYADIGGIPLRLIDTAGIRETGDLVEKIGVERSLIAMEKAELILALVDGSKELSGDDKTILNKLNAYNGLKDKKIFLVLTKADLPQIVDTAAIDAVAGGGLFARTVRISPKENIGMEELAAAIVNLVEGGGLEAALDAGAVATEREAYHLEAADQSIMSALAAIESGLGADCATIDLAEAEAAIGTLLGETAGADVVSAVFSRFCVGK